MKQAFAKVAVVCLGAAVLGVGLYWHRHGRDTAAGEPSPAQSEALERGSLAATAGDQSGPRHFSPFRTVPRAPKPETTAKAPRTASRPRPSSAADTERPDGADSVPAGGATSPRNGRSLTRGGQGSRNAVAAGRSTGTGRGEPASDRVNPAASEPADEPDRPPADGMIAGVVVTQTGTGVAGARVQVLGPLVSGDVVPEAWTRDNGGFVLAGLPLISSPFSLTATWREFASDPTPARAVVPDAVGASPQARIVLKAAVRLSVSVNDSQGEPIPEAKVFVKNLADAPVCAAGVTDADGHILFEQVALQTVVVQAEKLGYSPSAYGRAAAGSKQLALQLGSDNRVLLVLDPTTALSGTVVDAGGQPVSGAQVFMRLLNQSGLKGTTYGAPVATTGDGGRFVLQSLPAARVQLCAAAGGHGVSGWTPVTSAAEVEAVLSLLPPLVLRGRVVDSRNQGVSDAIVSYQPADEEYRLVWRWQVTRLGDDGGFVLAGIPARDGSVAAQHDRLGQAARALTAAELQSGDPLRLVLVRPDEQTVVGYVLAEDRSRLPGATVRAHAAGTGLALATASTDAEGAYTLTVAGPGPWTCSAAFPGLAPAWATVSGGTGGSVWRNFTLGRGASVAMEFVPDLLPTQIRADAELAVNLALTAIPAPPFVTEQKAGLQAQTWVFVDRLCPGEYLCRVSASDMAPRTLRLTVQDAPGVDQVLHQSVALNLAGGATGHVVTTEGLPMAGARVRLDGAAAPTVLSEADGRFMLTGLAPGTVTLRAETADRFGLAQGLTIVSGATVDAGAIRLDAVRTDTEAQTLTRVTTGIIWRPDGTGWAVDRVLPEANAAAASLLPGDRLVAVDAAEAAAWSLAQLQSALAGEPGTSITLRLERNARSFTIRVQRQALPGQ